MEHKLMFGAQSKGVASSKISSVIRRDKNFSLVILVSWKHITSASNRSRTVLSGSFGVAIVRSPLTFQLTIFHGIFEERDKKIFSKHHSELCFIQIHEKIINWNEVREKPKEQVPREKRADLLHTTSV
jgi:hypothetical protein